MVKCPKCFLLAWLMLRACFYGHKVYKIKTIDFPAKASFSSLDSTSTLVKEIINNLKDMPFNISREAKTSL